MNIKKCFLLLLCLTFFNAVTYSQTQEKKFKLVLDAGHGGEDPGCRGRKTLEKNVTLNVALKVGKLVSDNFDDVQVIYTRKTDVFVEVYKRAVIANNNHADLFISFHCNAAENKSAHGIETWVMGLAKSEANMEVARKENAAILKEKNFENNYEGFNPNSPEANVIFSLHTSAYMNHSILLADKVQRNLIKNTHLFDRTVKQDGFWVLYKVAMPSILIELGFLSNAAEEEYMIKPGTQDIMAVSIYNAFVEYRNALDGTNRKLLPIPAATDNTEKSTATANSKIIDPDIAAEPTSAKATVDPTTTAASDKPAVKADDAVASEPTNTKPTLAPATASSTVSKSNVRFRVQIAAIPENVPITDSRFSKVKEVRKFHEGKFWKYTCGNTTTLEDAQILLKSVKNHFPDAFIIAFDGETKIPVSEAVKKLVD